MGTLPTDRMHKAQTSPNSLGILLFPSIVLTIGQFAPGRKEESGRPVRHRAPKQRLKLLLKARFPMRSFGPECHENREISTKQWQSVFPGVGGYYNPGANRIEPTFSPFPADILCVVGGSR